MGRFPSVLQAEVHTIDQVQEKPWREDTMDRATPLCRIVKQPSLYEVNFNAHASYSPVPLDEFRTSQQQGADAWPWVSTSTHLYL